MLLLPVTDAFNMLLIISLHIWTEQLKSIFTTQYAKNAQFIIYKQMYQLVDVVIAYFKLLTNSWKFSL